MKIRIIYGVQMENSEKFVKKFWKYIALSGGVAIVPKVN